ncbi:hypothetical protein ACGFNP_11240 [Nonomuraea sp. NPDC049269]|uniref:hypothetical protein n=1 Tax=Nonomuraea sp. NPDC049269 TaxID=3364349 RepID=UPI003712FC70
MHKLNRDFFDPMLSCGVGLPVHYLLQKGAELERIPKSLRKAPYAIVVAEIGIPILLTNSDTQRVAIVAAMLLHYAFGILAHVHFSMMMIAALVSFRPELSSMDLWLCLRSHYLLLLLGMVMGWVLGNHVPYRWRALAIANHMSFSGVWLVLFWMIIAANASNPFLVNGAAPISGLAIFTALFAMNGLAPYFGLKTEFSFAMFSNLRLDRWTHWLFRRPRSRFQPRYLRVIRAESNNVRIDPGELSSELAGFDRNLYAIGFLCACIQASNRSRVGSVLWVEDGRKCGKAFLISNSTYCTLPFHERLSVFPISLPIAAEEPVCE